MCSGMRFLIKQEMAFENHFLLFSLDLNWCTSQTPVQPLRSFKFYVPTLASLYDPFEVFDDGLEK